MDIEDIEEVTSQYIPEIGMTVEQIVDDSRKSTDDWRTVIASPFIEKPWRVYNRTSAEWVELVRMIIELGDASEYRQPICYNANWGIFTYGIRKEQGQIVREFNSAALAGVSFDTAFKGVSRAVDIALSESLMGIKLTYDKGYIINNKFYKLPTVCGPQQYHEFLSFQQKLGNPVEEKIVEPKDEIKIDDRLNEEDEENRVSEDSEIQEYDEIEQEPLPFIVEKSIFDLMKGEMNIEPFNLNNVKTPKRRRKKRAKEPEQSTGGISKRLPEISKIIKKGMM